MDYISSTRLIRKHYVNAKFWFVSWSKERSEEFASKIKIAIAELKVLLSRLLAVTGDYEERQEAARIAKEIESMEQALSA